MIPVIMMFIQPKLNIKNTYLSHMISTLCSKQYMLGEKIPESREKLHFSFIFKEQKYIIDFG